MPELPRKAPAPADHASVPLEGLVVDWGGVLTQDVRVAVARWAAEEEIDVDSYVSVMRDWLGEPAGLEARFNPIQALERGELQVPDFEQRLAAALAERSGRAYEADGLLTRMFAWFEHAHDMVGLVRRAHSLGIRTALLSNSWGNDYPRDGWDEMFDVVVISGEVGMRKPEREIFLHTARLLGLAPRVCAFVDDLPHNVAAAAEVGFIGVHHRSYAATAAELEALFGRPLA